MIQDIYPHVFHNEYHPDAEPRADDAVLCFRGGAVLLESGGTFPKVSECGKENLQYLFCVDNLQYFLMGEPEKIPDGFCFADVRQLRSGGHLTGDEMLALMTGKHLADWYRDCAYCGRCGERTVHSRTERAMVCPKCAKTFYPRIMPAVIVGVKHGDRLLLTRYRTGIGYNALIAGFTEIGETAEQTVHREVMEEAGVHVKNIRYFTSQPWGIANDLLLGYYCELDGDDTIRMDERELKYAEWVRREDIELQPDDYSLTNEMMKRFKLGLEK